jgi:hypothetical protein
VNTDTTAALEAVKRKTAIVRASKPDELARSVRTVQAGIRLGLIAVSDVLGDDNHQAGNG